MKILLTGATGFIGKNLLQKMLGMGYEVIVLVRKSSNLSYIKEKKVKYIIDSNSISLLSNDLKNENIDGVIHLASLFINEHKSSDINNLIESNITFATRILELVTKINAKWFINTGTFWQHYNDSNYNPVNLYAATKQCFEDISIYYREKTNINFITLKLSDTYGPNDNRKKIFNLWKNLLKTDEQIEMSGGEQLMDIVYIDDVIEGYLKTIYLIENELKTLIHDSYAISSGNPLKLKDLAALFSKIANKDLNIIWGKKPYKKREVMVPWSKGFLIPGWEPKIKLENGIKRFLGEQNE